MIKCLSVYSKSLDMKMPTSDHLSAFKTNASDFLWFDVILGVNRSSEYSEYRIVSILPGLFLCELHFTLHYPLYLYSSLI